MALGKPVVTLPEARRRRAQRRGLRRSALPIVPATEGDARRGAAPARRAARRSAARSAPRAAPTSSRCTTSTASPTACSTSTVRSDVSLAAQMRRLVRHSAIYGLGGLVSRILATILLPLYTHYLPPSAYGQVEIVTAATAVLAIVLQLGIASAFFRFYFDAKDAGREARRSSARRSGSRWRWRRSASCSASSSPSRSATCSGSATSPTLVRAGAVGLWAQTNYQQLTALFRVEERSVAYAIASVANVLLTVVAMVAVRRRLPLGRDRPRRRQLHRHAHRLPRPARLPPRAARPAVRPRALPPDADVRDAARPVGARAVGDQLHRPRVRRPGTRAAPRSASTRRRSRSRR